MKRNNRISSIYYLNRRKIIFPNKLLSGRQMESLNLAQKSFLVYEAMGNKYLFYDKNWGDDLDIIKSIILGKKHLVMFDAGCGPGWHLEQCAKLPEIDHLIGIDYSPQMLRVSHRRLANFLIRNRIQLIQKNILDLCLPPASVDVAVCLNNTLGNLLEEDMMNSSSARVKGLAELKQIIRRRGYLIISVLNRDTFSPDEKYGKSNLEVDFNKSDENNGDFVVLYKTMNNWECPYFSHWFKDKEIIDLLSSFKMEILELKKRYKRIIVVARKK